MKYVPDITGRFRRRPYYESAELDSVCDEIISEFMKERYGKLILPIPTDALTKLIERDSDDLDLYADLSEEGIDVQGVTDFYSGRKPKVRIARELSEQDRQEHRLRTTLTHEYGHVRFHKGLWDEHFQTVTLFSEVMSSSSPKCKREKIINASVSDWMEWQAGYVCGAVLMPISSLRNLVSDYFERNSLYGPLPVASFHAESLRNQVANIFGASRDAAKVRLIQLRYLTSNKIGPSLFR